MSSHCHVLSRYGVFRPSHLKHGTCFPCYGNRVETAINHVVELGASWLLLAPVRLLSMLGGGMQTAFQLAIIVSGNLSFLNHLTILPFVWCFDDRRERRGG